MSLSSVSVRCVSLSSVSVRCVSLSSVSVRCVSLLSVSGLSSQGENIKKPLPVPTRKDLSGKSCIGAQSCNVFICLSCHGDWQSAEGVVV